MAVEAAASGPEAACQSNGGTSFGMNLAWTEFLGRCVLVNTRIFAAVSVFGGPGEWPFLTIFPQFFDKAKEKKKILFPVAVKESNIVDML